MGGPAQPSLAAHWWMGRIDVWVRTGVFPCEAQYILLNVWHKSPSSYLCSCQAIYQASIT